MHRLTLAGAGLLLAATVTPAQETPVTLMTRAVERAGGDSALRAIRTARLEYVTTWMRTTFADVPSAPALGIEENVDLRDYDRQIWRYERNVGPGIPIIRDVVRDSVAIYDRGRGWQPLSGAYVHERRELFLSSAERLLVTALDAARAGGLSFGADTAIAGATHARLVGTLDGFPATLFLRRSDAQLTGFRFRAAQPWDFGLAAWDEMEVELWYSNWRVTGPLLLPFEVATNRVGVPYKRLTIISAEYNVPLPEDSVAVSDSLRRRYMAEQHRAMFDLAIDSLHTSAEGFTTFAVPGAPLGTVQQPAGWLLYGSGVAPMLADRAVARLRATGQPIVSAIVGTMTVLGAGGAPALARAGIPIVAAEDARTFLAAMFRQQRVPLRGITWVSRPGWQVIAGDSLWLEPVDMPDDDGGLLVWDPTRRWLYAGDNVGPVQIRTALRVAASRHWPVDRVLVRGAPTPIADVRRMAGLPVAQD